MTRRASGRSVPFPPPLNRKGQPPRPARSYQASASTHPHLQVMEKDSLSSTLYRPHAYRPPHPTHIHTCRLVMKLDSPSSFFALSQSAFSPRRMHTASMVS